MALPHIKAEPTAFCITVNGEVVAEAGKHGVIKDREVAMDLRHNLILSNPEADVLLFGLFTVVS